MLAIILTLTHTLQLSSASKENMSGYYYFMKVKAAEIFHC